MFRNPSLRRLIAQVVLITFYSMNLSSVLAQSSSPGAPAKPPASIALPDLLPLQNNASSTPANNAVLLPLTTKPVTAGSRDAGKSTGSSAGNSQGSSVATISARAYSQAMAQLQDLSQQATQAQINPNWRAAQLQAQVSAIRNQYRIVLKYEVQARDAFVKTGEQIRAKGLPATILQRQQAALALQNERISNLRTVMAQLDAAASGKADPVQAIAGLQRLTSQFSSQTDQKPTSVGKTTARAPQRALAASSANAVGPVSSLSKLVLPERLPNQAPLPQDLSESPDLQLTPEIRALAASLNNNPVQIANWVRSNIRFTPGIGSMQGAAATLLNQSGNATDSATLLIALLRAANVPARYVYGTIEVPAARVQAWLGVETIDAAQRLLSQSGVANQAVLVAGQKSALQLEHVWVNAWVDYGPSRGAVNRSPNTWVPIDPSLKLRPIAPGLNLRNAISLNEAAVFDATKNGASCTLDTSQHLDPASLGTSYTGYLGQLSSFISGQGADIAVGDVLGQAKAVADAPGILPGSLPWASVVESSVFNALPDNLRWQFRLQLFADSASQSQNQPVVALSGSFAQLLHQRITLSYSPATQIDADTLAAFMPVAHPDNSPIQPSELPTELPAYLIQVKAELRVDGNLIASSGSFTLSSELLLQSASFDPAQGSWSNELSATHAGDYSAIALDAQGISNAYLNRVKQRMQSLSSQLNSPGGLNRDDSIGDVLYQTILNYFATADANSAVFQRAANVAEQRQPSYGRAVAQVMPHLVLGVINSASFPGVILAIDQDRRAIAANRADDAAGSNSSGISNAAYLQQSAQRNNAFAHQALNQLYTSSSRPGQAASSVNVLASVAIQNQPVFGVTASNLASVLPQIALSARGQTEVRNAVASGYRVLVPQGNNSIGNWNGQALLLEDNANPPLATPVYRLLSDNGSATSALYLPNGMPWLALAQPFQAATSLLPSTRAAQNVDGNLQALLQEAQTRWQFFPAKDDVANGLFLARLAASQGSGICDRLTSVLAANRSTGIDPANPGGINIPVFTSNPVTAGTAGQRYQYPVSAIDPGNAPLSFKLVNAPGSVSISSSGLISWTQPVSGSFPVTVRADNGQAYADQSYLLSIGNQPLPLEISLALQPVIISQGQSVNLTVLTNGGSGNINTVVKVDGQIVALDASGKASIVGNRIGVHPVEISASDSQGSISKASLFSVKDPQDSIAPLAQISSPLDDAEITAPVNIVGSASDANLAYYQLLLRPAGSNNWQEIGRGSNNVSNGTLGKLDPTQLANGIYELALTVVDINGQQTTQQIALDIYRDLKIGQFSLSFEDLNIEAAGIPIRVTRTYDTRRKGENLDFGYGWSVDYQSLQVRKNKVTGLQWNVTSRPTEFKLCLTPVGKRKINVALPTGKVERFTAANAKECEVAQIPAIDIRFTPLPGTTSKLEMVNVPNVVAQGGVLFDSDKQETWNQLDYKLTTEDKYVYYLTEGIGITSVQDRYGNTLNYGQNGIVHSNGQSITFTRDAAKRITAITDPVGKSIRYSYDARGDLTSVTDRENASAKFNYNRSHGLLDYTDPRNVLAARYVYDDAGRVVAVYDGENHAVEMAHDTDNNKEVVKNGRGFSTTYTYDDAGNVTEIVDALKNKTTITYDGLGNEIKTINALNKITLRSFDPQTGKQLTETDPLLNSTTSVYEGTDLKTYTDARKNVTSYGYANDGSLTVSEPLGRASTIGFDAKGNVNNLVIAGQATTSTFDAKGNKQTETDAQGNVTSYTYDDNNRETSRSWTRSVLVNGVPTLKTYTSSRKYDANGKVIEETDAANNTSYSTYDATGQLIVSTDPQGRKTRYEYDSRGKLTKTTYPDDSTELTRYDAESNPVSKIDRQKRETLYEYDELNRLTKTSYPDGSSRRTEYDALGRVTATIDGKNQRTENRYDDAGRLTSVTDPDKRVTRFEYDANGNRTKVTDANLNVTEYEYDALNRLTKTTWPDLKFARTVWRADGRKQSETDTAGKTTEYGYSPTGQLTEVKQSDGKTTQITQYSYDSTGNKAKQIDAELRTTRWEFDANNRVSSRTLPGLQKESFSYDEVGNLKQKTDFNGNSTQYQYNKLQQPELITRPDGVSIINTYTASGQIASVSVTPGANNASGLQAGKTSYQYDAQDRITRQTNPDGSFLAYGYDANGNITQRSTAAGTVGYEYNASGQLSSVTDIDKKVTSYQYDTLNRLSSISMPNGINTSRRYDVNHRLLQIVHRKADSSIVSGVFYKLADNGQRLEMQELDNASSASDSAAPVNPLRIANYQYDDVNRLTQEQITERNGSISRTTNYEFDKVGNRSKKTDTTAAGTETVVYSYDSNDRLQQETRTTGSAAAIATLYAWDNNGNLKSKTVANQLTLYFWDSDNRLTEVKQGTSEAAALSVAKYRYDVNGNRVAKIEPGQGGQPDKLISYLTDSSFPYAQVVQETSTQGAATESTRYVWGSSLIGLVRGGQGVFYHQDGLGSTKVLTDQSGNVTDSYEYEAYGNVVGRTGSTVNGYRYTGEYFDDAISLQYNRARWYAPSVGRFASQDRFPGFKLKPMSLNKYNYANGNPANYRDPSGKFSFQESQETLLVLGIQAAQTAPRLVAAKRITYALLALGAVLPASFLATDVCFKEKADCKSEDGIPIIVFGRDYLLHTQLVNTAQGGGAPFALHRIPSQKSRTWLKSTVNCADNYGTGSGLDCDEYPYANSYEGGEENIDSVWLALVPAGVNRGAGGKLGTFLTNCRVIPTHAKTIQSTYIVRTDLSSGVTRTYCKNNP